jgi:hypothetical protein
MSKAYIRPFLESDANEVYAMLRDSAELHVGGLTYSEKAVQKWHVMRSHDVILVADTAEPLLGS